MFSRKRKIDNLPTLYDQSDGSDSSASSTQSLPVNFPSTDDIHAAHTSKDLFYRPRSKNGRKRSNTTLECSFTVSSHGASVEIGEQVLNYRGQRIVDYKPGRPQNPARLRLTCEMGDVWENRYGEVKLNQVIKTGEKFTDRVLEKLQNHGYAVQEVLAKGRFGNVVLVYSFERAKYVAVKFLLGDIRKALRNPSDNREPYLNTVPDEVLIYESLRHPNIVELFGYQLLSGRMFLTMEFCENGSLTSLLQARPGRVVTEAPARRYFCGLISAVEFIHSRNAVHLDLRTQNLLVDQHDTLKIADFDSARRFKDGDALFTDKVGHKGYVSSEVLEEKPYDPRLVDIWSCGIVLFKMIAGRLPFKSDRGKEVMLDMIHKTVAIHFRCPDYVSALFSTPLQNLLLSLLKPNPEERATLEEVKRSQWFTEKTNKVYIGNIHLVQQPQKKIHGTEECRCKKDLDM